MIDFTTELTELDGSPMRTRDLNGEALLDLLRQVMAGDEDSKETAAKALKEMAELKPLTLKSVAIEVLKAQFKDEQNLSGELRMERGMLAKEIFTATGPMALKAEQVALLKRLIGKSCTPLVVMQAWSLIDPACLDKTRAYTSGVTG